MNSVEVTRSIMEELERLRYRTSDGFKLRIISSDKLNVVEDTILSILTDKRDGKLAELEAKVKVYEEIISKSNFKPFVLEDEE